MKDTIQEIFQKLEGEWDSFGPLRITKVVDDGNFSVFVEALKDESIRAVFCFEEHIGYRNFDEGDRLPLWQKNSPLIREKDGQCSNLYVSKDSELLSWIKGQSPGLSMNKSLKHYLIPTNDDIVEALAFEPPKFTLLE